MNISSYARAAASAAALLIAVSPALQAQTFHDFIGPVPASTGTSSYWTVPSNWNPEGFPDATDAVVRFGALGDPVQYRANIPFNDFPNGINVAAVMFMPDLDSTSTAFVVRNYNSALGIFKIHGYATTINETPVNLLIGSFGTTMDTRFEPANGGMKIELNASGVVHVEGPGMLRISTETIDADGGSYAITKTGDGILRFDRRDATWGSDRNSFSGGFILEDGTVEFTYSGGYSYSPFGTGPITLRGGMIRSTSDTGRTIYNPIILDGGTTFGSLEAERRGNMTINSDGGLRSTTLVADSTLTILNERTSWNQAVSGDFALTKDGPGILRFTGSGGDVAHTGSTTVLEGTLNTDANFPSSAVEVRSGAALEGMATFGQPVTIRTGATLTPLIGMDGDSNPLQMTFASDLLMEAGAFLAFSLAPDASTLLQAHGAIGIDGVNLLVTLGFQPDLNAVFVLIDNQSGNPITGQFSMDGTLLGEGDEVLVTTGEYSQLFAATYTHGGDSFALVAVPEPSAYAVLTSLAVLGLAFLRRRRS